MKKIISLLISAIMLMNTTLAYTVKVRVKNIDLEVTSEPGNIIEIEKRIPEITGWKVESGGITIVDNKFTMPQNNVEIEAIIPYELKIESPLFTRTELREEGETITVTATNDEDNIFVSWTAVGITLSATETSNPTITFEMPGNDVTLTASYQSQTYTVTYDANGGSGAPESQQKQRGVALTLSDVEPQRSGYMFLGWSTDSTATTATYLKGGSYTADANVTLYAVWQIGVYSINTSPMKYASTLGAAIDIAGTGNTITLLSDTSDTVDATIPSDKTLTLDLNGKTLSNAGNQITVLGTLTITDSLSGGKINSTSTNSPIEVEGTLNITGGTINAASSTNAITGSESSTITLGTDDGTINTLPSITGSERGILSLGTVNYYDGVTNGIHATVTTPTGKLYAELNGSTSSLVDSYVTTNLVSYYEVKNNSGANSYKTQVSALTDLAGSTNATLKGPTIEGNALVFDGTNDWLNYGVRNYANLTVESFFEYNETSAEQVIMANYDDYLGYGMHITADGKPLFQAYYSAKNKVEVCPNIVLVEGEKYHMVGTYDGANLRLYLNGVEVGSGAMANGITHPTATSLAMGVNPKGTDDTNDTWWFKGKLYTSRIYNGALTAEQVAQNYRASMAKDSFDIHTGGTVANNGVCSICSKKYITISGYELEGTSLKNQNTTVYANGSTVTGVKAYFAGNATYTRVPIVTADGYITLGTTTYSSDATSAATYANGVVTGKSTGGIVNFTATTGEYSYTMKAFVYNATFGGGSSGNIYYTYKSTTISESNQYDALNGNKDGGGICYMTLGTSREIISLSKTSDSKAGFCNTYFGSGPVTAGVLKSYGASL